MATTLRRGEIAIIGVDTEDSSTTGRDTITVLLMAPIEAGTVIYITDRNWNGTAFSASGDGTITYTAATNLPAGTVLHFTQAQLTAAGMALAQSGETIYVYQGTNADTPKTFLHAVDIADSDDIGGVLADGFDGNELLNTGLIAGVSAVAIGVDNAKFGTRTWNINKEDLFAQINNATDWNHSNNHPQPTHVAPANGPLATAPSAVIYVAASGAGEGIVQLHLDNTHSNGTVAYAIQHALQNHAQLTHPSDITLDPMHDAFFFVDSDVNGVNRIMQGKISDLLATPGGNIALTVLWSGTATVAHSIRSISIDVVNKKVYFDAGTTFNRVNYDTANQAKVQLADLGGDNYITQMSINYNTGTVYLGNSVVAAGFGTDIVDSNQVFVATGLTGSNSSLTFNAINFGANSDTNVGPEGGALGLDHWPVERGSIRGIDIDESTGLLYIVTGTVILDNDGNGNTTYRGGIWTYNPANGAVVNLYTQNGSTGPVGLLYYIDVDPITGRYYVIDETGTNADPGDSSVWSGALGVVGAPTFLATVGNVSGLGPQGLEIQHAPLLSGTGVSSASVGVTEASNAPNSGETSRVSLFSAVSASELDLPGGDELRGAVVRVSNNFVVGNTGLDYLTINGTQSGTIVGSGIAYSYNINNGTLTLSGPATVAEYQAAIQMVQFSTSGDNPTDFGNKTTRQISASVFDGLLYSDEIHATVTVTAINDAPVNVVGGAMNFTEDTTGSHGTPVNAITGLSVSDVDADPATQDIIVSFSVNVGTLSIRTDVVGGITAADIVGGNGTHQIIVQATQNQINATLAATNASSVANGLVFTPPANFNGAATLTMMSNDAGWNGNDPALTGDGLSEQDMDFKTLNVADVNDAPLRSGDGTEEHAAIFEDQPRTSANALTVAQLFQGQFSDPTDVQYSASTNPTGTQGDAFAGIAIVSGTSSAAGQWQFLSGGLWIDIGSVSVSAAKLINASTQIRFNPAANYNGPAPTLVVHLVEADQPFGDGVSQNVSVTGGTTRYSTGTVSLSQTVNPVNDAPTSTLLSGDTVTWTEHGAETLLDNGVNATLADIDSANFDGGTLTVSVGTGAVAAQDQLVIRAAGGISATATAVSFNGTQIGTLAGGTGGTPLLVTFDADATPAAVQALLRAVAYTNSGGDNPTAGARTINWSLVDGDGTANGGADTLTMATTVNVVAVDDAPVVTVSSSTRTFTEGVNGAADAIVVDSGVTISDPDHPSFSWVQVIFNGANGGNYVQGQDILAFTNTDAALYGDISASFDASNGFLTLTSASGTATQAQFQAAARAVTYDNLSEEPNTATRSLQIRAMNGSTVSGGGGVTIQVVQANDSPSGTSKTVTINEDSVRTLTATDFGFTDVDADTFQGVRFDSAPTGGTLFYDSDGAASGFQPVAISTFPTGEYSAADITGGKLSFVPTANASGAGLGTITFTVIDNGGTANGGNNADVTPNVLTLDVNAVNDAPSGQDRNGAVIQSTGQYVFLLSDFTTGYTDVENHAIIAVKITTLPSTGTMMYDADGSGSGVAVAVTSGQVIPAQAITDGKLTFVPAANSGGSAMSFTFQIQDGGGTANGGVDLDPTPNTFSTTIQASNVAPTLDLNGGAQGTGSTASYTEHGGPSLLAASAELTDADDTMIESATVWVSAGFLSGDYLTLNASASGTTGTNGAITFTYNATTGVLTLTGSASLADYQAALRQIGYEHSGDAPGTSRTISWKLNDGDADSNTATTTVTITDTNDAPINQVADATVSGTEDTNIAFTGTGGNGLGVVDFDGAHALTVTLSVLHGTLTLSGVAGLTFSSGANGSASMTFTGTASAINAALEGLTYRGVLNYNGTDTLTFTTSDNGNTGSGGVLTDTDTVEITLTADGKINGDGGDNNLNGTAQGDMFYLQQAGSETISGLGGNDSFLFGAFLDSTDKVDGGAGTKDQLGLQGNYGTFGAGATPHTLGVHNLVNIETLALLSGSDTRFGEAGNATYSYNLKTVDENVAAGQLLTVNFNALQGGENVIFDGSAETNGSFFFYGGGGIDIITGGAGNDSFFFGTAANGDALFGASDQVHGGAGTQDQLGLRGNYNLALGVNQLTGIETLSLLSGKDTRFGAAGPEYDYQITTHDNNVAAGQVLSVNANTLREGESLIFNGSAETNGSFIIRSGKGADTLFGGALGDTIYGNAGADQLYGRGGNDVFLYRDVSDSTFSVRDQIHDFELGDIIDLSAIDANIHQAGNQAFTFSATGPTNVAGQLWVLQNGNATVIFGDVDGDGTADFAVNALVIDGHILTANDFTL